MALSPFFHIEVQMAKNPYLLAVLLYMQIGLLDDIDPSLLVSLGKAATGFVS